ncbi:MAG: hypothetical protein K8F24_04815 [Bacteroidales bacterium]|nr:hypothetical protein [Bacteroidales bacterium]
MKLSFKSFWAVALLILISLSACTKDDDVKALSCNLTTAASEFSNESIDVIYRLEATGDAKVSSFFYFDETGKVEVQNPSLPTEIQVTLTNQKTIQAGAIGNVTNGSIKASYKATALGVHLEGSDFCSQSTN